MQIADCRSRNPLSRDLSWYTTVERTGGYSTSGGSPRADSLGVVSAHQCP